MFISPIFTPELVESQIRIINNEWIKTAHEFDEVGLRFPQLLMSNDQPSELFLCGNEESLRGTTAKDVELFWKTHYTADNMKLAISVHKNFSKAVLKTAARTEPKNINVVAVDSEIWSPAHKDQYLKVYTKNARRNYLHLYWHIHCDALGLCDDSLEMTVRSIRGCLPERFENMNLSVKYGHYSYDEFFINLSLQIRDKELDSVNSLKDEIISLIKSDASNIEFSPSDGSYFEMQKDLASSLSTAMMVSINMVEAPIRAHFRFEYSNEADALRKAHLETISNQTPQMILSYKSTALKEVKKEGNLLMDRYYFFYYQFVNFDKIDLFELPSKDITVKHSKTNYSVTLRIFFPELTYPFQFLIGVFFEILLIRLKSKNLYYEHIVTRKSFKIDIYFENENNWEPVIREFIQSFSYLNASSKKVYEKAKKRWLLEIKNKSSTLVLSSIANYYAKILTSNDILNESSLLVSDPNPEDVTLKEVGNVGRIIRKIGNFRAFPRIFQSDFDGPDVRGEITDMWTNGNSRSNYTSFYKQPVKDETFIYVPPHISTANSGVMILFNLGEDFSAHSMPLTEVLYSHLYKRLRSEMNLIYDPKVNLISNKYIYIMVSSSETPENLHDATMSVIREIPDYIRGIPDSEWKMSVDWNYLSKESVIDTAQKFIIGNEAGRLIFQFWGRDKKVARNEYVAKMRLLSSPYIKLILSIKDYPRTGEIPEDLRIDDSSIGEDQIVENAEDRLQDQVEDQLLDQSENQFQDQSFEINL